MRSAIHALAARVGSLGDWRVAPPHRWTWHARFVAALSVGLIGWAVTARWMLPGAVDVAASPSDGHVLARPVDVERLRVRRAAALARVEAVEEAEQKTAYRPGGYLEDTPLDDDDLVDMLGRVTADAALRVDRVEPRSIDREADWTQRGIGVIASGSYACIANWIAGLTHMDRPVGIDTLRIERAGKDRGLSVHTELRALGMRTVSSDDEGNGDTVLRQADVRLPTRSCASSIADANPFVRDQLVPVQIFGYLKGAGRVVELVFNATPHVLPVSVVGDVSHEDDRGERAHVKPDDERIEGIVHAGRVDEPTVAVPEEDV